MWTPAFKSRSVSTSSVFPASIAGTASSVVASNASFFSAKMVSHLVLHDFFQQVHVREHRPSAAVSRHSQRVERLFGLLAFLDSFQVFLVFFPDHFSAAEASNRHNHSIPSS